MKRWLLWIFVLGATGCPPADEGKDAGADSAGLVDMAGQDLTSTPDMGSDTTTRDARPAVDSAVDSAVDQGRRDTADFGRPDVADSGSCSGACRELSVSATTTLGTGGFDRAYYGLTHPDVDGAGRWRIHVEVLAGPGDGCPTVDTQTDRTLVVTNFDATPGEYTDADGAAVVLFDYVGDLLAAPLERSSALTITLTGADVCTDCFGAAEPADPDGWISLDVSATLEGGGTVAGHVYATHCDSLDLSP